ncbi:lysylphosphatidylglycerol synthase transmembrane domain-containing protein [Sandaracinus amylolyticus]|uniref:Flippase-like domain-containing protein n=1 Tax=Sandaracinus amylolyticus TaxID=927083 RepID=A0A0F6SG34_9BACT|nr:lysylphosphatidylglycerol synthase transmembrane domain-containing protein [Sandaracinus amylolyticus]AKF07999.1 hypothetical protein DB32_005148 [Sandaracinus amylolyticus]
MSETPTPKATSRQWIWRIVRVVVTVLAFAWVLSRVSLDALGAAFLRVSWLAFVLAIAVTMVNMGVGTLRWRALLAAYGAPKLPSFALLYRLYLIGFFYNVWLPGGVGGDVVRGVASRAAFGPAGATSGVAVVFVERVLGLVGLLLIVGTASIVHPIRGVDGVLMWSAIGIAAGAGAVLAIALGRQLAARAPGPIARILAGLPVISRPWPFVFALALSLVTQSFVALTGHVFVAALHPELPLVTSFAIVPLAMSTSYLPITAGGAGAREAAFQELYSHVGVSFEDATAASLMLAATYYLIGALGGLLRIPPSDETTPPSA